MISGSDRMITSKLAACSLRLHYIMNKNDMHNLLLRPQVAASVFLSGFTDAFI